VSRGVFNGLFGVLIGAIVTACASPLQVPRRFGDDVSVRASRSAPVPSEIAWHSGTFAQAQHESKRLNRHLMLYMTTTWCGPCKRLDKTTFSDYRATDYVSTRLVAKKIDGDTSEGKALRKRFKVNSYPTMIFFRADSTEIDRTFGYKTTAGFIRLVSDMLADRNTISDMRRRAAAKPNDVALQSKLGQHLAYRGDVEEAVPYLRRVIALDPLDKKGLASRAYYVLGRYVYGYRKGQHENAIKALRTLIVRFPKSTWSTHGSIVIAHLYSRLKQPKKALAVLARMIQLGNKTPKIYYRAALSVYRFRLAIKVGLKWASRATRQAKGGPAWYLKGLFYKRAGKVSKAILAMEKAVRRTLRSERFKRALSRLKTKKSSPKSPRP
jgi:thioredoxin 1